MTDRKASTSSIPPRNDPFELDRLAEELATREGRPGHGHSDSTSQDLPELLPLSHDNPYLSAPEFNVEDFLLSRSYTSLPDLRALSPEPEVEPVVVVLPLRPRAEAEGKRLPYPSWPVPADGPALGPFRSLRGAAAVFD